MRIGALGVAASALTLALLAAPAAVTAAALPVRIGAASDTAATAGGPSSFVTSTWASYPLLAEGVVLDAAGAPLAVAAGLTATSDPAALAAQDAWLAAGTVPGPARYADMATQALRDLDALVLADGSVLAATSPGWDNVWPRDASFAAVALARTGHPDDALAVLTRLAALHASSPDGVFEARYVAADGTVPDDRARQLDGCGWALWAVAEWAGVAGAGDRAGPAAVAAAWPGLADMAGRCVGAIDAAVDSRTGLPGPWPDYWEVDEDAPTLGTLAALRLGVRALAPVARGQGEDLLAWRCDMLAGRLSRGLATFAPRYGRYATGALRDTAVAFLMPPFADADRGVSAAWSAAAAGMLRPGGGLAPGESWRRDGISWTPTTAVFALTAAASGRTAEATAWLDWLDAHRTAMGSLPEKVLADGTPAAVAPLAWTDALVLLTLVELGPDG